MILKISYHDREVKFSFEGPSGIIEGESIKEILKLIERHKQIEAIYIDGSSVSYSFSRQIYLLVIMLSEVTSSKVFVNGKLVSKTQQLKPTYPKDYLV